MVAAVSPSALSSDTFRQTQLDNQERDKLTLVNICSSTMGARKRRRQILLSQRQGKSDLSKSLQGEMEQPSIRAQTQNEGTCEEESSALDIPSSKLKAVSPGESGQEDKVASPVIVQDVKSGKKPQMRYEPSVPMTKEQAAAWRREQRRKRNRESAAASRQRQRDRISELEKEVMDWKDKFQFAVDRLNKLEALLGQELTRYEPDGVSSPHLPSDTLTKRRKVDMAEETSKAVSPCPSPDLSPMSTRTILSSCPTLSTSTFGLPKNVESEATSLCTPLEIVNEHSKENKSLPA